MKRNGTPWAITHTLPVMDKARSHGPGVSTPPHQAPATTSPNTISPARATDNAAIGPAMTGDLPNHSRPRPILRMARRSPRRTESKSRPIAATTRSGHGSTGGATGDSGRSMAGALTAQDCQQPATPPGTDTCAAAPALVTSRKADLAKATWAARTAASPIAVFDPAGFDPGARTQAVSESGSAARAGLHVGG